MPKDKNKKIPNYVRKDIRQRSKKEAGIYGGEVTKKSKAPTKTGTFLRKAKGAATGKPNKYGLKKMGGGADLPIRKTTRTPKKYVATGTRAFKSVEDGKTVEVKGKRTGQKSTTSKGLASKTKYSVSRVGMSKVKDPGHKEAPEFKENAATRAREKYKKGSRTKEQEAYDEKVLDRRRTYKRAGLSKSKNKRDLKKKYKEQARSGTYERNR